MTKQETSWLGSVASFFHRQKKTILLIIIVAALTLLLNVTVSIILNNNGLITLPSTGNIHTVGVKAYWDPNLQNQVKNINWSTVYTGQSYNVTLYLWSISNVPTVFNMTTTNWAFTNTSGTFVWKQPANSTPPLQITWNIDNRTLSPNETIQTTFTLTVGYSSDFITFLVNNNIKQVTMDIIIQPNEK